MDARPPDRGAGYGARVSARALRMALILFATMSAACEMEQQREVQQTPPPLPAPPPAVPPAPAQTSDTTAAGLWAALQSSNYRNWEMWPGKEELYDGAEPHGALLTMYVNVRTREALASGDTIMPPGALIVLENFAADSTLVAITAMYKAAGYDAEGGDWFWARWNPDGAPEVSGRADVCKACHSVSAARDFLMTTRPPQ
jgi:hypothetical protein